jgi:hypothetical protein
VSFWCFGGLKIGDGFMRRENEEISEKIKKFLERKLRKYLRRK